MRKKHDIHEGNTVNFNQFKTIFNAAANGMRLIDYNFNVQVVNEAFLNLIHLNEDQVVGQKCYDVFHSPLCNTDKCPVVKLKKYPAKKYSVETVKQNTNGQKIPVLLSAVSFNDANNQPIGIVEDFTDLTRWKELEGKLKAYNQQLHASNQQLQASDQQLRAAIQQLQATEQQLRAANQQLVAAEMQARLNAVKYKALFDGLNDAAFVHPYKSGGFGKFVEVNEVAIKKLGYSREEFMQLSPADISSHDDALLQGSPKHRGTLAENGFSVFEAVHIAKDGTKIPVEISSRLFEYNNEKHILSVARDISDRKKAEAELSKLSTAVSQSPALVGITDLDGNIEYVNPKIEAVTGYTLSELKGENFRILKSGEQPFEMYQELWKTISSGKNWRGEFSNKKKNGELYWESALISPVTDSQGKITHYIKIAEDITDKKHKELIQKIIYNLSNAVITTTNMEEFAHVVKNELSRVIETANFYIALYDDETDTFTMASHFDEKDSFKRFPAAKTLTGYVQRTKQTVVADKAKQKELEALGEIDLVGTPSKIWIGVPLMIDNQCIGVVAVQSYKAAGAFDQSDIEMLEIVARQISISINRKKQEEELREALDKAQESDRLKTAFLTNMSHEIRTPMNGILGFTNLLKEADFSEMEKEEFINNILASGERLLNTVNDIVDISKIEAGQMPVSMSEVSIDKLLKEIHSFFEYQAEKKGLLLKTMLHDSGSEEVVLTDEAKLHGILTNLIRNAIKFTEKGGILVGYSTVVHDDRSEIEFFVEDTGIGIPADRQQAVFDRFVQADIADTRVFEGSGLGLAISKAYVEMLGGTINVESEEGKGSRFTFTIPYRTGDEEDSEALPVDSEKNEEKKLVSDLDMLVVEDEEVSTEYLKAVLKKSFRNLYFAQNGLEAVEMVKQHPEISIVLMDIKMPVMGGYEATREIRKFNNKVYIIAQTAYALTGDREKALEAGCNDYITKPINKNELLQKINKFLESSKK